MTSSACGTTNKRLSPGPSPRRAWWQARTGQRETSVGRALIQARMYTVMTDSEIQAIADAMRESASKITDASIVREMSQTETLERLADDGFDRSDETETDA